MSIFPYPEKGTGKDIDAQADDEHDQDVEACYKMSLCGTIQQTKEIVFYAVDNSQRDGAVVTALVHVGQGSKYLQVVPVPNKPYENAFSFSHSRVGVAIMEVFVDGTQISESPVRIDVIERQCDLDFPGERKVAVRTNR